MRPKKCQACSSGFTEEVSDFETGVLDKDTDRQIIVPSVLTLTCSNKSCGYSFLPHDQEEKIDLIVARRTNHTLTPDEIALIRQSLPFRTKFDAAKFLGLNSKAFTKWEGGYTELNQAYDILLRLVAFDRRNLQFLNELHAKKFRFDLNDYQLICLKQGLKLAYPVFSVVTDEVFESKQHQDNSEYPSTDNANAQ